ncbi:YaaC-like Protein [Rhodoblastus acidophilus]|uniref:YaaC-like Protein n=1 Tax=Rhodoblastus acidophilus TaxID=1074 RepID=A0A212RH30_RHOAC|nr:YaaC family protein [Rhodoblastus acidophilus]PPQ39570.1 hypothetical protein CKO16_04835 [Rhodoblastus acidophilus]RAI24353.1 hypothetical protein CH337_00215 [Rhodoblastus acidophilus]SNB71679.1 YaaC-like Protein [Rhodoblastus acidophilus]
MTNRIRYGAKVLRLHKAISAPQFEVKTVLTNDPFVYVDLWLRRNHKDEALFYWRQAHEFYKASIGLPIESAPLVLYYCFMNAAKALLSAKGQQFSPHHGVSRHQMRGPNAKVVLSNEGIAIKPAGIVPALSVYFSEQETRQQHSLEDVLYNLAYIHRTYCLSYPRKPERFLPLKDLSFIRDANNEVRFFARPVDEANWTQFKKNLPQELAANPDGSKSLVSSGHVVWATQNAPTTAELDSLRQLSATLRKVIHYINGANALWYVKLKHKTSIGRQSITLTLAAMHRLSEICRYRPDELLSFLNGQKNWLLSEFLSTSRTQFIDEIACEMTGQQIMIPNVRIPS